MIGSASAQAEKGRGPRGPWSGASPDKLARSYYDATSWIYRWAWGSSFHFAPLRQGESRHSAIRRYEQYVASELGIVRDSRCIDLGCGIGGPARTIASRTAARIVGVNSNLGQLLSLRHSGGGRRGLTVTGIGADFDSLPFADATFDCAYSFEALCHAVDLQRVLREVYRILRSQGRLAFSEWCLTERFDPQDETDRALRRAIEDSYGVVTLRSRDEWQAALLQAGFRIAKHSDQATLEDGQGEPWYRALQPRDRTLDSLGRSAPVRALEARVLSLAERCGLAPRDTAATVQQLRAGTAALIEAGRRGIFTPMMFVVAAKG